MLRQAMNILWPSFLVATIAEGCFFSLINPHEMSFLVGKYELPLIGCYTIGFFFFWTFCSLASTLTCYLINVPNNRNV